VKEFRSFWRLFLEWRDLPREGAIEPVCAGDACETARFSRGLRLNYAECLIDRICVIGRAKADVVRPRASERGTSQVELLTRAVVSYRRVDDDDMRY
jgi:hypothetical protein